MANSGTGIITGIGSGSLVTMTFHIQAGATLGPSMIDLAAGSSAAQVAPTELLDRFGHTYVLTPAPLTNNITTNGFVYAGSDPDDGTVNVLGPHLAISGLARSAPAGFSTLR